MQFVRTIYRVAEVAFHLIRLLRGNWSAAASLALSMFELYRVAKV